MTSSLTFVLFNENCDLVGHMPFQAENIICSPVFSSFEPCAPADVFFLAIHFLFFEPLTCTCIPLLYLLANQNISLHLFTDHLPVSPRPKIAVDLHSQLSSTACMTQGFIYPRTLQVYVFNISRVTTFRHRISYIACYCVTAPFIMLYIWYISLFITL